MAEIDKAAIRRFASRLRGETLMPDDSAYALACRDWTGSVAEKPGMVVRSARSEDVVAVVNFAGDHELPLAVRSGGHGLRPTDGGIPLDLSGMNRIEVKVPDRVANVQAGVKLADLDRATYAHGLAAVRGECPSAGISGFTLGGGLGRLMGQYGSLCDNLLSAEIITADGKVLQACATQNPDLFWGIRGGGGNFGIATSFRYRLNPVGDVLCGRTLVQSASCSRRGTFSFFRL